MNDGGVLFTLMYGEASSVSVNPIEKKPVFHFLRGAGGFSLGSLGLQLSLPRLPELGDRPLEREGRPRARPISLPRTRC